MRLLSQTVTVYRADGTRQVLDNCYFTAKKGHATDHFGTACRDGCTLIVRGSCNLKPGDRVMEGIGPEQVEWDRFLPELGACHRIDYVQPFFLNGRVSHVEAGGSHGY